MSSNSKRVTGILLSLIAIVVIALIVKSFFNTLAGTTSGSKATPHALKPGKVVETTPGAVTRDGYARDYNTTFYFSGQQIDVESVTVAGLSKNKSVVQYLLDITPAGGNDNWINKANFYLTRNNANRPASHVRLRKIGNNRKTTVTFKVRRHFLNGHVYLNINYPFSARTNRGDSVQLALDIPRS